MTIRTTTFTQEAGWPERCLDYPPWNDRQNWIRPCERSVLTLLSFT